MIVLQSWVTAHVIDDIYYAQSYVLRKARTSIKKYLLTERSQLGSRKMKCRMFKKDGRKNCYHPPITLGVFALITATCLSNKFHVVSLFKKGKQSPEQ